MRPINQNQEEENKNINLILQNKIIKKVEVDGFGVYLEFKDGTFFNFDASDGGYSTYEYWTKEDLNLDYNYAKDILKEWYFDTGVENV